jgi:O-antigen ligase
VRNQVERVAAIDHASTTGRIPIVERLRRSPGAHVAVAVLMILVLTQGPVYNLWLRNASPWDQFAVQSAIVATFVGTYLVVGWLAGSGGRPVTEVAQVPMVGLGALCALVGLSTAWSTSRSVTLIAFVGLAGVLGCARWFRTTLTLRAQISSVFVATAIGVLWSGFAIWRSWPDAIDTSGLWVGIYLSRNSLAPVATLALLSGGYLLPDLVRTTRLRGLDIRRSVALAATVGVMLVALELLRKTRSLTSLFAIAVVVVAVCWTHLARRLRLASRTAALLSTAAIAVGLVAARLWGSSLSLWLGRGSDFSHRGKIWRIVWENYRLHPWFGWGFVAAWRDPVFRIPFHPDQPLDSTIFEAHNGFLEILLGVGPIGLLLVIAAIVAGVWHLHREFIDGGDEATTWWIAIAAFCIAANLQESFIVGHHVMFLLLAAAILVPSRTALAGRSGPTGAVT